MNTKSCLCARACACVRTSRREMHVRACALRRRARVHTGAHVFACLVIACVHVYA